MKKTYRLNSTQEISDIFQKRSEIQNLLIKKNSQQSKYIQEYLSRMEQVKLPYDDNTIQKKLASHNINYVPDKFHLQNKIQILSIDASNNYQAIGLKIAFSQFIFQINILNIDAEYDGCEHFFDQGSFGKVTAYIKPSFQTAVIKQCKIRQTNKNETIYAEFLRKIIMEVFFAKFMSALQYGPSFQKIFGFDIIFYNDCAQFALELCQNVKTSQNWKNIFEDLPKCMKLMHKFQIIHGDIKPQNVLYSPSFNRFVFCDFGLTRFITQPLGEKTLTYYFGTFNYVCEDMSQLLKNFDKQKSNYVDLYYNDLYGLQITLSNFALTLSNSLIDYDENNEDILNQFPYRYELAMLKFKLFRKECQNILGIQHFEEDILKFLFQMKPSQYFYAFFIRHFGKCCNNITKYQFQQKTLRQIYTERGVSKNILPIDEQKKSRNLKKYLLLKQQIKQQKNNINKNDCVLKDAIKIITGKSQTSSLQQYCLLLSLFLNFWEEDVWSENIMQAIQFFQDKSEFANFLTQNNESSEYFRKKCQENNERFYSWYVTQENDKKLIALTYKLQQYFFLTHNLVGLNRMATFQYRFYSNFQHYNYLIQNVLVIQNHNKQYKNMNKTILTNFICNYTPFRINNDEKWFDLHVYKSLLEILDPKQVVLKQNLRKIIELSSFYGLNSDIINEHVVSQFQSVYYFGDYQNLYHITSKAMLVNIFSYLNNYAEGIKILNEIEGSNRFFDEQTSQVINYYLTRSFYIFYNQKNIKKALYIFEQMTRIPKQFQLLWRFCHAFEYLNAKMAQQQFEDANQFTKIVIKQLTHRKSDKALYFTYDPKILNTKKGIEYFLSRYQNFSVKFYKYLVSQLQSPYSKKTIKKLLVFIKHLTLQVQNCHRSEIIKKDCIKTFSLLKPYEDTFDIFLKNEFVYLETYFNIHIGNLTKVVEEYEKNQIIGSCPVGSDIHIRFLILVSLAYYWTFNEQKAGKIARQAYSLILTSNRNFLLNFSPDFLCLLQRFGLPSIPQYIEFLKILLKQNAIDDIWNFKSLDYVFNVLQLEQKKELIEIVNYFLEEKYYLKTYYQFHQISLLILKNIHFFYKNTNDHILLLKKIALTLDTFSKCKNEELFKCYFEEMCKILSKCKETRKKKWVQLRFLKNSKKPIIKKCKKKNWKHVQEIFTQKIRKRELNKKDIQNNNKIHFKKKQLPFKKVQSEDSEQKQQL